MYRSLTNFFFCGIQISVVKQRLSWCYHTIAQRVFGKTQSRAPYASQNLIVLRLLSRRFLARLNLKRNCIYGVQGLLVHHYEKKQTGLGVDSGRVYSLHNTSVQSCFGLADKVFGFVKLTWWILCLYSEIVQPQSFSTPIEQS